MKKIIITLVIATLLLVLVSCGKENEKLNKILEKKEIVIVTSPDYAPFEFIDLSKKGDDKYVGADIELMKFIASELGVKLKIEVADFSTTLTSLRIGSADLAISGFTYEKERAENYEMSIPYFNEGDQGVLILAENLEKYQNLASLNKAGIKIGAQDGSLQADYVIEQLSNTKLEKFMKIPEGVTLLNNKIIDGISISTKIANIIIQKNPNKYVLIPENFQVDIKDTEVFVFAKKGEVALIEKINEILEKVKAQDLYTKWIDDATDLALSLGEL